MHHNMTYGQHLVPNISLLCLGATLAAITLDTDVRCIVGVQCFSRQMVTLTGAAPDLISPSVTYLKIRAWSAPAVLISMVAQVLPSACSAGL